MRIHPAAWSLFLLLAVGVVGTAFLALQPGTTRAPDFSVPTTDNETATLGEHRGRVLVLDFFAIYCADCKIIEKNLEEASVDWDPADAALLSIGVAPHESLDELREYRARQNITWAVARDEDDVARKYGVFELGRVVIVDAAGNIVFSKSGSFQITPEAVREVVEASLRQEQAPVKMAQYGVWGLAVVAAVASFFSPCAIGLLPGYIAHTVRTTGDAPTRQVPRAIQMGLLAAAGLLLVFLGIGGLTFLVGRTLTQVLPWFGPLIGLVLILVGIWLFVRPYSVRLQRMFSPLTEITATSGEPAKGRANYFLYGMGYGAGASGCTAPVLLSLVATAAAFGPLTGILALFLYAGTAAALMVVLTFVVAGARSGVAARLRQRSRAIEALSSMLFIAGGVFLLWYARRAGTLPF